MGANPLDFVVDFVFKMIFGFILGFVGIYIAGWMLGNAGYGIIWLLSGRGTWVGFSLADTSNVFDHAFSFMSEWFPYAWYVFQWVVWLLLGSWTGWFSQPTAPWL